MSKVEDLLEEIRSTEKASAERDAYMNGIIEQLTEAIQELSKTQHFDESLKTSISEGLDKLNQGITALSKVTLQVNVPDVAKTNTNLTRLVQEIKDQNEKMASTITSLVADNTEKYEKLLGQAIDLIKASAQGNSRDIATVVKAINSQVPSQYPNYSKELDGISKSLMLKKTEWNFEIVRGQGGRMKSITATAK